MQTLILAFIIILLAVIGLATGTLLGRGPIKGSCGRLACVKNLDCGACKAKRERGSS